MPKAGEFQEYGLAHQACHSAMALPSILQILCFALAEDIEDYL